MAEHNVNTVKTQIQSLINLANTTTGNTDTNLTDGVNALVSGYGQGGEVSAEFNMHFGDDAPADANKLWCDCVAPTNINIISTFANSSINPLALPDLPKSLGQMCSASVGKNIYLFGGGTYDWGGKPVDTIYKFNTETKEYTLLSTTLPSTRSHMACGVNGSNIYLFGGVKDGNYAQTCTNEILKFDTKTETIEVLSAKLPSSYARIGTCTINNKIYLFGGGYDEYGMIPIGNVHVFDTETETISTNIATMPENVCCVGVAEANGKIYLFGGATSNYLQTKTKSIYEFSPTSHTFKKMSAEMPLAIDGVSVVSYNNMIYLFGGNTAVTSSSSWSDRSNVIYKYDSKNDTLTTLDITMGYSVGYMAIALVDSSIYLFGGSYGSWDGTKTKSTSLYELSTYLEHNKMCIVNSSGKSVNLFKSDNTILSLEVGGIFIGNNKNNAQKVSAYVYDSNAEQWVEI